MKFTDTTFPTPKDDYDRQNESQFRSQLSKSLAAVVQNVGKGPFVDISQEPYNATGDGVTDETDKIQAALDAVAANGGGIVFAPAGTYVVSALLIDTRVHLMGEGWDTVLFQAANSHTVADTGTSTGSNSSTTLNDTGKSWGTTQYADLTAPPFGYTVRITSGLGSGQSRRIVTHTATRLTIDDQDPWTTTPDATSHYSILKGKHVLTPQSQTTTQQVMVTDLTIDGNKSNQIALNRGIDLTQVGTPDWETNDCQHIVERVKIRDCSGDGFKTGINDRECLIRRVWVFSSGKYNFELRGTDNHYEFLTSEASGLHGIWHGEYACGNIGSKVFGSGKSGLWITQPYQIVNAIVVQDSNEDGIWMLNANNCFITGQSDRNGITVSSAGIRLTASDNNVLNVVSINTTNPDSGMSPQDYAIYFDSDSGAQPTGNLISLVHDGNSNLATVRGSRSQNTFFVNDETGFYDNEITSELGDIGDVGRHLKWGKNGAGTSGDPAWELVTDGSTPPISQITGYDGTYSRSFMDLDYGAQQLRLGTPGSTSSNGRIFVVMPTYSNAQRPSAGIAGRVIFNSDAGKGQMDDGANWNDLW